MEEFENAIELKNVTKRFRIHHERKNSLFEYITSFSKGRNKDEELYVLRNISLSIRKGEMIGVIGFNGTGKTTLLKIISGIYPPTEGTVVTRGKLTPFLELGTGFNGELTARDNIILYGAILGFSKKEIVKKIDDIIQFAELEKFLDTKLKNFSSGMNARLAFSTAIQVNPDILLVDEILSVGDLPFQQKSFEAFMDFKKKGKTIVFVSHSIDHVSTLCDRVMLLHEGRVYSYGEPDEVINEYKRLVTSLHSYNVSDFGHLELNSDKKLVTRIESFSNGKLAKVFDLDGYTYVTISNKDYNFERWDKFTLVAKVKSRSINAAIIAKMNNLSPYEGFDLWMDDKGRLKSHLINKWPINAIAKYSTQSVNDDKWHNVAVTYDGSGKAEGIKLYIDGIEDAGVIERNSLTGSIHTDCPVTIGSRNGGWRIQGQISDLHIFKKELSAREVSQVII